jgi:DNA-binding CsgD family transcriptional regulator/type II secretory pathway predicted ATPase ExeA
MTVDVGRARAATRADLGRWPLVGRSKEIGGLREAVRARRGAVVTGPAGVGKTSLAMVGVNFAEDQGMAVALVAGTEAARPYPFGAFASLLPIDRMPRAWGPESHAELLRHYTRELTQDAGGRPLLVFVDDAHLLDDGSAMLVHQLSQTRSATVLACVLATGRTGQPTVDPMVVLWKDHLAERIELGPLDETTMEDLLVTVLGGPIDAASMHHIAERSLGDPLFLRELVAGALDSGALADENGLWRLRGTLRPTPRLVELVTLRLGNLTDAERHVMELAALGEPLAQPTLDELADTAAVEALEDRGFITSRMDGRRLQIWLAHPVYGDVVRQGISARRERALARALAEASGGRRQEDTLLLASLRLVGGGGSGELLLAGAKAARERHDFALTEKMARAALENGEGFDARYLAAEAAHVRGRHAEAAQELEALARDATSETERVRVALLRFDHDFFLRGHADMAGIDELLALVTDPSRRDELLARRMCLNGLIHGPKAVTETPGLAAEWGRSSPRTSLHVVVGESLTRQGKLDGALALLVPPEGASVHQGRTARSEPWSPYGNHALALIALGRLREAEHLLSAAHESLMGSPGSLENAVVAVSLGALRMEQGRVQGAFMQATSSAALFLELGLPVSARWSYALSALSLALAGVADKAAETLAELDGLGLPTDMSYECEVLQARAWTSAAGGDMGTARQHLEVAVELGVQVGDLVGASRALHGLARMGRARQVVDQLGELAARVDGDMSAARLTYAAAAAAKDSAALQAAAARFEEVGANLYAAEALGEAAVHLRRDGSARDGAAAQQKAARLLARCEGAVTPFVRAIGARAHLTPAELDTALQAATGSTDKQIAEMMHLSVRTVENRLHRAYQKLGLSHRRELAEALRDLPGA